MLQHCPDLRHVVVQTRRGDHRALSERTELGRRSRCGMKWGVISLFAGSRCHAAEGNSPRSVPRWPLCVPFCCRPLGATAAWFATVFLYLCRVENRDSETARTIARISLRISFPFTSPFSPPSLSFSSLFLTPVSLLSILSLFIFDSKVLFISLYVFFRFSSVFSFFYNSHTWISSCRDDNLPVISPRDESSCNIYWGV